MTLIVGVVLALDWTERPAVVAPAPFNVSNFALLSTSAPLKKMRPPCSSGIVRSLSCKKAAELLVISILVSPGAMIELPPVELSFWALIVTSPDRAVTSSTMT